MRAYRDQYASLFQGGRNVVLIAISTDAAEEQQSWAQDEEFPFLFASDPGGAVGQEYGAFVEGPQGVIDNRTLFIVDQDGRIAWRAAPFREIDPTAYEELGAALSEIASPVEADPGGE